MPSPSPIFKVLTVGFWAADREFLLAPPCKSSIKDIAIHPVCFFWYGFYRLWAAASAWSMRSYCPQYLLANEMLWSPKSDPTLNGSAFISRACKQVEAQSHHPRTVVSCCNTISVCALRAKPLHHTRTGWDSKQCSDVQKCGHINNTVTIITACIVLSGEILLNCRINVPNKVFARLYIATYDV